MEALLKNKVSLLVSLFLSLLIGHFSTCAVAHEISKVHHEKIPIYGIELEKKICEASPNCGGLVFGQDLTRDSLSRYEWDESANKNEEWIGMTKLLFVPLYYSDQNKDVFVSSKPWLIQRGSVTVGARDYNNTVISHSYAMTIDEAKEFCYNHDKCVAFSFPLQTEKNLGMTHFVDEIIFVNKIAGFDIGDQGFVQQNKGDETPIENAPNLVEWVTHIVHDRTKLSGRVKTNISVEDGKWDEFSTTPYRPCCHAAHELPSIEEIQAMDELPRIPCNISRQEFHDTYEVTRTPVMLVDCDKDWPAHDLWKDVPTLMKRFDNSSTWNIPHQTSWGDFQEFYLHNVQEGGEGFRVFSQLDPGYNSDEIHKDYYVPRPFQGADVYEQLPGQRKTTFSIDYGPMHWFVMGSFGTGSEPHIDPHSTDAWNTVIHGHKWWIIYPKRPHVITEEETNCLVSCSDPNIQGGVNRGEELSWFSSIGRHAHKMYYGHDEAAMQVLQKPGETIYLPYGMIHTILNMGDTIAITQNYGALGNFNEVWKEILLSRDQMDWKRMYYHNFDRTTRKRVRDVMWPVTQQKINEIAFNLDVYRSIDDSDLEHFSDDGPYDEFLIEEEFLALPPEERAQFTLYTGNVDGEDMVGHNANKE